MIFTWVFPADMRLLTLLLMLLLSPVWAQVPPMLSHGIAESGSLNLKTDFCAQGDGITDDTTAPEEKLS